MSLYLSVAQWEDRESERGRNPKGKKKKPEGVWAEDSQRSPDPPEGPRSLTVFLEKAQELVIIIEG